MECKTTAVTTCGDSCIVFVAGVNEGRANVGWSCECVVVFVGWYFDLLMFTKMKITNFYNGYQECF
jgi:hypothetical protein